MIYKLFKKKIFLALLMLIILVGVYPNIYHFTYIPTIPKLIFRCTCFFILGIMYVYNIFKTKKIDIIFIICLLYSVFQIFSTIINKEDLKAVVYSNLFIALSCLIITDVFIVFDAKLYILISFLYFFIMTICNAISGFFLTERNFTTAWFYGNRNDIFKYFMPLIFFTYILSKKDILKSFFSYVKINFSYSDKILKLIIFFITFFPALYCKSLSTTLILLIYIPYLCMFSMKDIKLFNIYLYLAIVSFSFVVFVLPGTNNPIFSSILPYFGKSVTASSRFNLYDVVIKKICNDKYLLGHGFLTIKHYMEMFGTENGHSHSTYLEIMFRYGIIGVIFSFTIFSQYVAVIKRSNNVFIKNLSQFSLFMIMLWSVANTLYYFQCLYFFGLYVYFIGKFEFDFVKRSISFNKCMLFTEENS